MGEILIWEATNLLLLIPMVTGFLMLVRWLQGRLVFTDRDWRFLFGQPPEKVFTLKLSLRFAALWFAAVMIGFAVSFYVLPYGLMWFAGALLLLTVGMVFLAPKWLR